MAENNTTHEEESFRPLIENKEEEEYFYKRDHALIMRRRRAADLERKQREMEQRKALHWMKCPKCGASMQEVEMPPVRVDRCTECQGIYFDRGELEIFMKMNEKEHFLNRLLKRWEEKVDKRKFYPI